MAAQLVASQRVVTGMPSGAGVAWGSVVAPHVVEKPWIKAMGFLHGKTGKSHGKTGKSIEKSMVNITIITNYMGVSINGGPQNEFIRENPVKMDAWNYMVPKFAHGKFPSLFLRFSS